jgi:hypothetical protein
MSFERCWDYAARVPKDLFNPSKTPNCYAVLVFFVLSASQNTFCLLLKAKNPALSCWVLFVTPEGF